MAQFPQDNPVQSRKEMLFDINLYRLVKGRTGERESVRSGASKLNQLN